MHVVHVCATSLPVPPTGYGGTERLVFWLAREQQRQGLRVSVIAHPDSRIADLLPGVRLLPCARGQDPYAQVPGDADVLHLHRYPADGRAPERPYLITEHGLRKPGAGYLPNTVFVSAAHARLHGSGVFVFNGVPVDEYRYAPDKQDYFLFMARMEWPRKNARTALNLAIDAALPLCITGDRTPWGERRVWGRWLLAGASARRLIRPCAYVDGTAKQDLLSGALALFHIVNWHEPFSLVAHEALASGTPVLASPNGALAESIRDGHNGALVNTYAEALAALQRLAGLAPMARRELAERCRASAATMQDCAAGYLLRYRQVVAGQVLGPTPHGPHLGSGAPVVVNRPGWRRWRHNS